MNIFLGVCSLVLCTILGYFFAQKYCQRRDFFNSFSSFNKRFKGEVGFTKNSIISLVDKQTQKDDFYKYLADFLSSGKVNVEEKYLNKEDVSFFYEYLKNLGVGDVETQIKYLDSLEKQIELKVKEATENDKKYRSLYIKLGFLIGLVVLIVLL